MQQRYYDPMIPRFLSADPVSAYSDPIGQFHRYRYANNNPYRLVDPDGRQSKEMIEKARKKLTNQPLPDNKINRRIYRKDGSIRQSDGRFNPPGGPHRSRKHDGVDIGGQQGEPVPAAGDGTVTVKAQRDPKTGELDGYGNYVDTDHGEGVVTRNAHLDTVEVETGQNVKAGEILGTIGTTGNASTPHDHFEIIVDGKRIDPALIFNWEMEESK